MALGLLFHNECWSCTSQASDMKLPSSVHFSKGRCEVPATSAIIEAHGLPLIMFDAPDCVNILIGQRHVMII